MVWRFPSPEARRPSSHTLRRISFLWIAPLCGDGRASRKSLFEMSVVAPPELRRSHTLRTMALYRCARGEPGCRMVLSRFYRLVSGAKRPKLVHASERKRGTRMRRRIRPKKAGERKKDDAARQESENQDNPLGEQIKECISQRR